MKTHIAVWLDHSPGPFFVKNTHRALLALAAASGGAITAFLAAAPEAPLADAVVDDLTRHGAQRILCLRLSPDALQTPEAPANALAWALEHPLFTETPVTDVVAAANATGRDCMARFAARRAAPLLQDCIAVDFGSTTGEKYLLQGRVCGVYSLPGPLRCWTIRPHVPSRPVAEPSLPATVVTLTPPPAKPRIRPSAEARKSLEEAGTDSLARIWAEQPDIVEAATIVSGGRALQTAENFRLLHDVAAPLQASVGASRSAVDMGLAPSFAQVGQTGVVVSPALYIACGISGSIFHTVGIKGARNVVAINTDPAAPIFLRADYGITDDLFVVLPLLRDVLSTSGTE